MSHDRTGERIDDEQEPLIPVPLESDDQRCPDPRCKKGWLGYDAEDRPIPCLRCKPHLTRTERLRKMGLGEKK